jgi:NitT/TauT family transport system ATP-binding protein
MARLGLKDITVSYGTNGRRTTALDKINLDIEDGDFVSLIGPSGCGKSTLLDLVAGLRLPTSGQVSIDGHEINGPGPDRGVVFQDYSLFPWMSALENVRFAVEHSWAKTDRKESLEIANRYLDVVGLSGFADKYPNTLSGGMRQRLAIARMFSLNPEIFLMDEPFGALDSLNRVFMQDLLVRLWSKDAKRKTVLFVTHDVDEAILLSDRVVVMTPTPGRIKEVVSVPFSRPRKRQSLFVSQDYIILRSKLLARFSEEMQKDLEKQEKELITWSI